MSNCHLNIRNWIMSLVLMTLGGFAHGQTGIELFEEANKLYNETNYAEAIEVYQSILAGDEHSAEVYFNLANAYYKTNQIAPSIYYYEKALQLAPNDKDISNNLAFAQNMTIDAFEVIPEVGLSRVYKNIVNGFSSDLWAGLSVVLIILFVLLFLSYYFAHGTNKKRFMFLTSFVSLFLCLVALTMAFQKYDYMKNDHPAIVFATETEVRTDPNLRSETAFRLHEGAKVQIIEEYDDNWSKIKLSDGKTGWISSKDILAL